MRQHPEQPTGVGTYTTTSPVLVHAVQLTEDANWDAIAAWCGGLIVDDHRGRALVIPDVEPRGILSDWVIQGVTGKYFFRYPEEFAATYTPAVAPGAIPDRHEASVVLRHYGVEGGYRASGFVYLLLHAMDGADAGNFARFRAGWPGFAQAVDMAKNQRDGIERLQAIAAGQQVTR